VRGRRLLTGLAAAAIWLAVPAPPAHAQTLNLTISPSSITFPSADPDTTPLVQAPTLTVRYRVRGNGNQPWRLTVLASGDLIAGAASIDISNVTWTARPAPPFQAGTASKTVEQTVAAGTGNVNPARTGQVRFRLVNSWTYSVGLYAQTFVFTLSAP
jgi:hypothetical protein